MNSDDEATSKRAERPWTEAEWERFIREHEGRPVSPPPADGDDEVLLVQLGLAPEPLPEEAEVALQHEDFGDEQNAQISHIAAFRLAQEFAGAVHSQQEADDNRTPERAWRVACWDDLVAEAWGVARQLAAGHGLGYEDEHICGNIVKCREALGHAERGIALLQRLRNGQEDRRALDHLMSTAVFMKMLLEQRVAALRQRVWWDDRRPAR